MDALSTIVNVIQLASNPKVQKVVGSAVELVGSYINSNFPLPYYDQADQPAPVTSADRRVSAGLTKRDGKIAVALLVEKGETLADRKAEGVSEKGGEGVVHIVTGTAYSSRVEDSVHAAPKICVGASIGHIFGFPGSVGAVVELKDRSVAITSAAHVLSRLNKATIGDYVIAPGHPDGPNVVANKVGVLENFSFLKHHTDSQEWENRFNDYDIALVKLDRPNEWNRGTVVPDSQGEGSYSVKDTVKDDEVLKYLGTSVFKVGRTTKFTKGELDIACIEQYPLRLPDGRIYLYRNLIAIKGTNGDLFSKPGDSGALVYTEDFRALGFIVGGSQEYTFACSAHNSLAAMSANIV